MKRLFLKFFVAALSLAASVHASAQVVRQINWGYADNTIASGIGTGSTAEVSGAIYIPAEVSELYKGQEMKGLRIGLKQDVTGLTVFVKKDLDGEPLQKASFDKAGAGLAYYKFDESFKPDGEGFYVGYTCTGLDPIGCSTVYNADGCWINRNGEGWKNLATDENFMYNALNIAMRFGGSGLPFDVRIVKVEDAIAKQGTGFTLSGTLENLSGKAVRNYQIAYSIDGGEQVTTDFSTYLGFGNSEKFSLTIDKPVSNGKHTVTCTLVSVNNGKDDYEANNVYESSLNVTDRTFVRRMVVEEGTGTWCGYCPRGTVALKEMYEKYPDSFIGIAVHCRDEMSESTYTQIISDYFTGYPTCIVNRDPSTVGDISSNVLEMMYKTYNSGFAIADVTVNGYLDNGQIEAEASAEFMDDQKNADYRIAFVVLEDGVTGYQQANYYSGSSTPMGGWENLPTLASVDFNHVARGIYDYKGIEGSLPAQISASEKYTFAKTIDLPTVQKTTDLHLVALLIDGKTGLIVNAAKAKITDGPTGITGATKTDARVFVSHGKVMSDADDVRIEVFNATGMAVANTNLSKGTYIVRLVFADGHTVVKKIAL